MKYWNRRKQVREKCWIRFDRPTSTTGFFVPKWLVKQWCQKQPSPGKFFLDDFSIWFERTDDAAWFALTWL
jgi:hypothetical protein